MWNQVIRRVIGWQKIGIAVAVCLLMTVYSRQVQAEEPFTRNMNVTYVVQENGNTTVRYEIRLRNNFSTVYAQEYALQINSPDVKQVAVRDSEKAVLPFETNQTALQTTITVAFPDAVVGRGSERLFTIEYTSTDTASIYGQVLEITIPKLANPESYEQYNVVVMVPTQYGNPSLVEPAQYTIDEANGFRVLRFTNVGKQTGISVLFGDQQTYDFDLTYHVANNAQNVGVVQVALPPDTALQRVWYESIVPQPESIHRDEDGNWIAEFRVAGQAEQTIRALGQATVFVKPTVPVPVEPPYRAGSRGVFQGDENPYLRGTGFWQVQNATVQAIAADHQTPQSIYQYIVDTLQYNYKRATGSDANQRLGAVAVLQDPANAMCQEFTDAFIAVARAAGVPARRATGYAITQNSELRPLSLVADVLHAWPEYYDSQRSLWIPIDPTWADTTGGVDYFSKLDLRHITFAIQGTSDTLPLPAGMYKLPEMNTKDVVVELADAERATPGAMLTVEKKRDLLPQVGVPTSVSYAITNETGQARYNVEVALGVEGDVTLLTKPIITIPVLLPFTTQEITAEYMGQDWLQPSQGQVIVLIDNERHTFNISARRAVTDPKLRWALVGLSFAGLSAGAGSVLVLGLRWHRSVRR